MRPQEQIEVAEFEVTEDMPRYPIKATKITFFNLGDIPVYVGLIPVMPGDVYQVNYEHPHIINRNFGLRFDTSATPVSSTIRDEFGLVQGSYLVIQTMTPHAL